MAAFVTASPPDVRQGFALPVVYRAEDFDGCVRYGFAARCEAGLRPAGSVEKVIGGYAPGAAFGLK